MAEAGAVEQPDRCEHCVRVIKMDGICPHCGFDGVPRNDPSYLPEGTIVRGRYMIGRVEGRGGFKVCYRAWDFKTETMVAVKELFPRGYAFREDGDRVGIPYAHRAEFGKAKEWLRHEGEVLMRLRNEIGIVQTGDFFEENETAYLTEEFLRSITYDKYLEDPDLMVGGHLPVVTAVNVALRLLDYVEGLHDLGFLYLDIKPPNILICDDTKIILTDLGSALDTRAANAPDTSSMLTPGFSPVEQHYAGGKVSPATDVYSLAATLYFSLSREIPMPADERAAGEPLIPIMELNPNVPPPLAGHIEKAMALNPQDRFQTVGEFKAALKPFGSALPSVPIPKSLEDQASSLPAPRGRSIVPRRVGAGLLDILIVILAVVLLAAIGLAGPADAFPLGALLWWIVQILGPITAQATPGTHLMGLTLKSAEGPHLDALALVFRVLLMFLFSIVLPFTADREGRLWHDRLTDSLVGMKSDEGFGAVQGS